jgi:hypothetical protein
MHIKDARWLEVTVIQVVHPHATNTERDPRVSWLVWIGDQQADLVAIALGYALRFSQAHLKSGHCKNGRSLPYYAE